jgi:4-amino-4-deoxy-L-arabinose transferase-like glycosyltransferase
MTRSNKLGLASFVFMVATPAAIVVSPNLPFAFVFAVLSCVLALLAAQQGRRWWLAIPALIVAGGTLLVYIGWHAR